MSGARYLLALVVTAAVCASLTSGTAEPHELKITEVHGVRARGGRQLQQTFGPSSIVPMVVDDSPCVSFNADDSSPILDAGRNIVGYTTVHSNGYDTAGLSILRLDVVAMTMSVGNNLYFASQSESQNPTNVRAHLSTELPDGCPASTPASSLYSQGVAVECSKRRATLDMSVPTSLFNCTVATTEDFNIVFFLQLEIDLASQQCGISRRPFYAGSIYNSPSGAPPNSGCTYIMVTAACKPSNCPIDRSALPSDTPLNLALGSVGRIDVAYAEMHHRTSSSSGLSSTTSAIIGGVVGGAVLAAAVVLVYVLYRRNRYYALTAAADKIRSSHSIATDYLDADRFDSFTIDTAVSLMPKQRDGRRSSRLSLAGRLSRHSTDLRAQAAGRWRDKFGIPTDGGTSTAISPSNSGRDATGAYDSPSLFRLGSPRRLFSGASISSFTSHARLPSVLLSPRMPSVFAQPTASQAALGSVAVPDSTPIKSGMSMSVPRRGSMVAATAAVPMVLGRSGAAAAVSAAAASNADAGIMSEDETIANELAPPDGASSVFLNPLAIILGGRFRAASAQPERAVPVPIVGAALAAAAAALTGSEQSSPNRPLSMGTGTGAITPRRVYSRNAARSITTTLPVVTDEEPSDVAAGFVGLTLAREQSSNLPAWAPVATAAAPAVASTVAAAGVSPEITEDGEARRGGTLGVGSSQRGPIAEAIVAMQLEAGADMTLLGRHSSAAVPTWEVDSDPEVEVLTETAKAAAAAAADFLARAGAAARDARPPAGPRPLVLPPPLITSVVRVGASVSPSAGSSQPAAPRRAKLFGSSTSLQQDGS